MASTPTPASASTASDGSRASSLLTRAASPNTVAVQMSLVTRDGSAVSSRTARSVWRDARPHEGPYLLVPGHQPFLDRGPELRPAREAVLAGTTNCAAARLTGIPAGGTRRSGERFSFAMTRCRSKLFGMPAELIEVRAFGQWMNSHVISSPAPSRSASGGTEKMTPTKKNLSMRWTQSFPRTRARPQRALSGYPQVGPPGGWAPGLLASGL